MLGVSWLFRSQLVLFVFQNPHSHLVLLELQDTVGGVDRGELSVRRTVDGANFRWGKLSMGRTVDGANC